MPDLLEEIELLRGRERRVAMAMLIGARGGSPRPLGAKMFIGEGGERGDRSGQPRLLGSVSIGGCVDARVVEHGSRLLGENRCERVTVAVDDTEALELGLTCGAEFDLFIEPIRLDEPDATLAAYETAVGIAKSGHPAYVITHLGGAYPARRDVRRETVEPSHDVFVERIAPPDTLVLVGASDVAAALTRFARALGFHVVVVDGREQFATPERFPAANEIRVGMPSEILGPLLGARSFLVLAAHDYRHELPILREALRSPVRFVGMLAGRKRAASVRALLREDGLSDEQIGRLHAPIGLDIGGREPEEIALSIAAQLVAIREGKPIARRP